MPQKVLTRGLYKWDTGGRMTTPARSTSFVAGLDARLRALGISRYRLAQLSGLHENTVHQWWHSTSAPSMESLAKIAPHLNMSYADVLEMAGYERGDDTEPSTDMNVLQQDVLRRCQGMVDVAEALDSLPEEAWRPYVERILDRTEDEIREAVTLLLRVHSEPVSLPNVIPPEPTPLRPSSRDRLSRQRRSKRVVGRNTRAISLPNSGCSGSFAPVYFVRAA